ncbi:uncharacterized protein LOC124374827 [Homalodisca vitripennis]|uniref:uncharacterized protein LOC124374827 n=1 Tax=Homalodisca vitripennis TaxID=197043 RepID=UPI001EECE478|nr:uncharacterized protein LOC124374827 [Homalodisca vitripennis]
MSPVTTAVLHETDVQDYMKCSKIMIHAPEDKKANANFTAYFKNEVTPPLQVSYRQEEVGCGHINDIYDDGQYQVYFLNVNKAVCIYRCPIAPTKGVATAGALVSVANQNSPDVVAEVQSCKESLASVGFTGHLVNVDKCSA